MENGTKFGQMFEAGIELAETAAQNYQTGEEYADVRKEDLKIKNPHLMNYAQRYFIDAGSLMCDEAFEYGLILADSYMPASITEEPLMEEDIERIDEALKTCGHINDMENGARALNVTQVQEKIGRKWGELTDFIDEQSYEFYDPETVADFSAEDLDRIALEFQAGGLLYVLGYFLREEERGFPLTG